MHEYMKMHLLCLSDHEPPDFNYDAHMTLFDLGW